MAMSPRFGFGALEPEYKELDQEIFELLKGKRVGLALAVLINVLADLALEYDEVDCVLEGLGLAIRGKLAIKSGTGPKGNA